jgi:hypothetical protein
LAKGKPDLMLPAYPLAKVLDAVNKVAIFGSGKPRFHQVSPSAFCLSVLAGRETQRLRQGAIAGHNADVFAVAPGGQGLAPGDSLAVAEGGHAVDGIDEGAVVPQQDMATHSWLKVGRLKWGAA